MGAIANLTGNAGEWQKYSFRFDTRRMSGFRLIRTKLQLPKVAACRCPNWQQSWQSWIQAGAGAHRLSPTKSLWLRCGLALVLGLFCLLLNTSPAFAVLNDDHYDGNIFPLYGGNGYLVPVRLTLAEALKRDKPTLLVLYVDDSRDCKNFAPVVSQVDAYYGRVADILPISVDSIYPKDSYDPTEPGYYYHGEVPQSVIFDRTGKVVFSEAGNIAFEKLDDKFRELFDLLPRSESIELKRRAVNEINTELVQ